MSRVIKVSQYSEENEKVVLENKWSLPILKEEEEHELEITAEEESEDTEVDVLLKEARIDAEKLRKSMLEEAQREIEAMRESALAEIEKWKSEEEERLKEYQQQLFDEANVEGYREGYNQGLKAGLKEYEEKIRQGTEFIRSAEVEWKKRVSGAEPFILELAIDIAEKVIRREIDRDDQIILEMVKQTLKLTSDLQDITLLVSPDDFNQVKAHSGELAQLCSTQANLVIIPDVSMSKGNSLIRTAYGSVDARIDTQLEEIRKGLMEVIKGSELVAQ